MIDNFNLMEEAIYGKFQKKIAVSVTSVYNKLHGIEVNKSTELVRYAAQAVTPIIEGLKGILISGYWGNSLHL